MTNAGAWEFTDDRGAVLRLPRRPERVVAYIRAGAALQDAGIPPVAVYGSGHDGDVPDPVKAGALGDAGVPYLGPGRALDDEALGAVRPDLVVEVTYDGKSAYALDEAAADRIGVPLLALSVGTELSLRAILGRFAELSGTLGGEPAGGLGGLGGTEGPGGTGAATVPADRDFAAAEQAVRTAAEAVRRTRTAMTEAPRAPGAPSPAGDPGGTPPLRVLALSGAGPDQVHLARPRAWPELARLLALGVPLVEPGPGAGANWLTADWERVAELRPDLVLVDSRANAVQPNVSAAYPAWSALTAHARVEPWNPETPPSAAAYGRFFRAVARALGGLGDTA